MKFMILSLSLVILSSCSRHPYDALVTKEDGGSYTAVISRSRQDPNRSFSDAGLARACWYQASSKLQDDKRCSIVTDLEDRHAILSKENVLDGEITFCGDAAVGTASLDYVTPFYWSSYCSIHKEDATELLRHGYDIDADGRGPWNPVYEDL